MKYVVFRKMETDDYSAWEEIATVEAVSPEAARSEVIRALPEERRNGTYAPVADRNWNPQPVEADYELRVKVVPDNGS